MNNLSVALTAPAKTYYQLIEFLQQSFCLQSACTVSVPTISYRFLHQPISVDEAIAGNPCIYQRNDLQVWQNQAGFTLFCGDTALRVNPATGEAVGWIAPSFWSCSVHDQRDFFLLSLLMLCHRQQCYGLHANGLSDNRASIGRGYLLVGNSGSGKTTLTMTLVRRGWRYLGDDVALLDQSGAGIQAYALRRDFACTPTTVAHLFNQTTPGQANAIDSRDTAKQIIPEAAFLPAHFLPTIWPEVICFTRIAPQPQSQLQPITQSQALITLAQQSAGIMTNYEIARQQLAFLKQLTRQVQSYQLYLGRDVFTEPNAVASLLQQGA